MELGNTPCCLNKALRQALAGGWEVTQPSHGGWPRKRWLAAREVENAMQGQSVVAVAKVTTPCFAKEEHREWAAVKDKRGRNNAIYGFAKHDDLLSFKTAFWFVQKFGLGALRRKWIDWAYLNDFGSHCKFSAFTKFLDSVGMSTFIKDGLNDISKLNPLNTSIPVETIIYFWVAIVNRIKVENDEAYAETIANQDNSNITKVFESLKRSFQIHWIGFKADKFTKAFIGSRYNSFSLKSSYALDLVPTDYKKDIFERLFETKIKGLSIKSSSLSALSSFIDSKKELFGKMEILLRNNYRCLTLAIKEVDNKSTIVLTSKSDLTPESANKSEEFDYQVVLRKLIRNCFKYSFTPFFLHLFLDMSPEKEAELILFLRQLLGQNLVERRGPSITGYTLGSLSFKVVIIFEDNRSIEDAILTNAISEKDRSFLPSRHFTHEEFLEDEEEEKNNSKSLDDSHLDSVQSHRMNQKVHFWMIDLKDSTRYKVKPKLAKIDGQHIPINASHDHSLDFEDLEPSNRDMGDENKLRTHKKVKVFDGREISLLSQSKATRESLTVLPRFIEFAGVISLPLKSQHYQLFLQNFERVKSDYDCFNLDLEYVAKPLLMSLLASNSKLAMISKATVNHKTYAVSLFSGCHFIQMNPFEIEQTAKRIVVFNDELFSAFGCDTGYIRLREVEDKLQMSSINRDLAFRREALTINITVEQVFFLGDILRKEKSIIQFHIQVKFVSLEQPTGPSLELEVITKDINDMRSKKFLKEANYSIKFMVSRTDFGFISVTLSGKDLLGKTIYKETVHSTPEDLLKGYKSVYFARDTLTFLLCRIAKSPITFKTNKKKV